MIHYYTDDSIFGKVTVASTKQGICGILFDNDNLPAKIAQMFPNTELYYGSVRGMNFAWKLIDALDDNINMHDIPVDIISGTPFQRLVWDNLRKIPKGTTITYSNLASNIGMPRAVRAVASACGANPVSIIIPCHRVVPKAGGTGKYRWGSEMKAKLIEREISNA